MGLNIPKAKLAINERIDKKIDGKWNSLHNLDIAIRNDLNNDEKEYLDNEELLKYYKEYLEKNWKKKLKSNIMNKLIPFYQDETCKSKEDLEKKIIIIRR